MDIKYLAICLVVCCTQINATAIPTVLGSASEKIANNTFLEPITFRIQDKTYSVITSRKLDFIDALHYCADRGLQLISLETQVENDYVYDILKTLGLPPGYSDFKTSATRLDGAYTWLSSGQSVNLSIWAPDYPKTDADKKCLLLSFEDIAHRSEGWWWNNNCSVEDYFICES